MKRLMVMYTLCFGFWLTLTAVYMASRNRFAADTSWDAHKQDGNVYQHVGITSAASEFESSVTSQLLM